MSALAGSFDKIAALCIGTTAMTVGLPPGAMEASIAASGVIGFFLGRREKSGPENNRVRQRIQAEILARYEVLASGSDGGAWSAPRLTGHVG